MSARLDPRNTYNLGATDAAKFGLGGVVRNIIAGLFIAIGMVMTRGLDALSSTFIKPLFALGDAGAAFVEALFANPAQALGGAWEFMLFSLTEGDWAFFGPLTPLVVLGVILAGLWMYMSWADRLDIDLPTTGDIPILNLDENSASEEE